MVQALVQYPDKTIKKVSGPVRYFDDELKETLTNMKDTINAYELDGLASIQIGVPQSILVFKQEDGTFIEMMNSRIIRRKDPLEIDEQTAYYPDYEYTLTRENWVSVIYEDANAQPQVFKAEGKLAHLIQRKFDYLFGGTFADKLTHKERKNLEKSLSSEGLHGSFESYDNMSNSVYFTSFVEKLLFFVFLSLFGKLFNASDDTLHMFFTYDTFATAGSVILMVVYYIYAKRESEARLSCTGCQVINFLAISIKYVLITLVLFTASVYLVQP